MARPSERSVNCRTSNEVALDKCCLCRDSLREPKLLSCLHNCCCSCFVRHSTGSLVKCPACLEEVSGGDAGDTNNFMSSYMRASALYSETVWCNTCEEKGDNKAAEFWCTDCCQGLCTICREWHDRFHRRHHITDLEDARTRAFTQIMPTAQCVACQHQDITAQCFSCCEPKCKKCSKKCTAFSHDVQLLSHKQCVEHISRVTKKIKDAKERLDSLMWSIVQKSRAVVRGVQEDRPKGRRCFLEPRRRLVREATEKTFKESQDLLFKSQEIWQNCPSAMARRVSECCTVIDMAESASDIRSLVLTGWSHRLKGITRHCALSCKASLRRLVQYREERDVISINGSLPLTADVMLRACFGTADRRETERSSLVHFRKDAFLFSTPCTCVDLAATRDGQLLLAAQVHGLLVYSRSGVQLSSWSPAKRSDGVDEMVNCVAELHDGRVAVGLLVAKHVVFLKFSKSEDTWREDCHLTKLELPARYLAAHGDLLAIAETTLDGQQQRPVAGRHIILMRPSSGTLLYKHSRDYDIQRVAITAVYIVTASLWKHNRTATPCVIDAFSHAGVFSWRYETGNKEDVTGLCAADTFCNVYAIVLMRDGGNSRVIEIGGAGGTTKREVMSSRTHGLRVPKQLSTAGGRQPIFLALLDWEPEFDQGSTVRILDTDREPPEDITCTDDFISCPGSCDTRFASTYTVANSPDFSLTQAILRLTHELMIRPSRNIHSLTYTVGEGVSVRTSAVAKNDEILKLKSDLEHLSANLVKVTVMKSPPEIGHLYGDYGYHLYVGNRRQDIGLYVTHGEVIYWLSTAGPWLQDYEIPMIRLIAAEGVDRPAIDMPSPYFVSSYNGFQLWYNNELIRKRRLPASNTDSGERLFLPYSVNVMIGHSPLTDWHVNCAFPKKTCFFSTAKDSAGNVYRITRIRRFDTREYCNVVTFDMTDLVGEVLLCLCDTGVQTKGKVLCCVSCIAMVDDNLHRALNNVLIIEPTEDSSEPIVGHGGSVWVRRIQDLDATDEGANYEAVALTSGVARLPDSERFTWLAMPLCACLLSLSEEYPDRFCYSKFDVFQ